MRRGRFVLGFSAIYLIWGSTYLAISLAVESIPPLGMMSVRSLVAGLILLAWSHRAVHTLNAAAWRSAFIAGAMLFLLSHGSLAWAEQRVPSGVAALLGATTPLWLALVDWRWGTGRAPGWFGRAGLALGFAGVALLVAPDFARLAGRRGVVATFAIVGAALAWAAGSVYGPARRCRGTCGCPPQSALLGGALWLAPPAPRRANGATSRPGA